MPKNDFENTNFANFEEVIHNFGWSDDDVKKYLLSMNADVVWSSNDKKILDGI